MKLVEAGDSLGEVGGELGDSLGEPVREEDIQRVKIGLKRNWRKSHPMLWSRLRIERI